MKNISGVMKIVKSKDMDTSIMLAPVGGRIKIELIKVIALYEYIITIEDFNSYKNILKLYEEVFTKIRLKDEKNFLREDFEPLKNVFKIYFESIPSDNKIAKYTVDKMQGLYVLYNEIM